VEAIDYPGLERQRLGVGDASGGRVSVALPRKVPKCPFTGRRALEPAGVTCAVPLEQRLANNAAGLSIVTCRFDCCMQVYS